MRLGLLADIHEHLDFLRIALAWLRRQEVDQIVVLGDIVSTGERLEEACRLLAEVGAIGVWGNHDFGLAKEPTADMRRKYSPSALEYLASLKPRLVIDDCLFTHVEPWLDPEVLTDLWYYEGPPDEASTLARIFNAAPQRLLFAGHFHRWLLAQPESLLPWNGDEPITLKPGRFFTVLAPVCDGYAATFDTRTSELVPLYCG